MAQQPVVVAARPRRSLATFGWRLLLLAIAIIIFIVLAIINVGDATFKYQTALAWVGFACFAGSFWP
jgi:uncharacterized integral membrane protein